MVSDKTFLSGVAIGAIMAIEIYALSQGIDGVLLSGTIAVIAGIAGYRIKGFGLEQEALEKTKKKGK